MATLEEILALQQGGGQSTTLAQLEALAAGQPNVAGGAQAISALNQQVNADQIAVDQEMQRIMQPGQQGTRGANTAAEALVTAQAREMGAPSEMIYDSTTGQMVDTAALAERMGQAQGASAQYLMSAPLLGSYTDEAMGAVDEFLNNRNPAIATETMRQAQGQFQENNPKTSLGVGLASGIVNSLPAAAIAGPTIAAHAPATLAGQAGYGAAIALPSMAAEGAIYGYGAGDDGNRAGEAATGGIIGGVLGGTLGAAAPFAANYARQGWQGIKSMFAKAPIARVADDLGISPQAAKFLNTTLGDLDLDAADVNLNRSGPNAMLADASVGASQQLDNALQNSGGHHEMVNSRVNTRIVEAGKRLTRRLDDLLGTPEGRVTAQTNIRAETAAPRKDAYAAAYAHAIDYASPEGRRIEGLLGNLPQGRVNAAIRQANELMAIDAAESGGPVARQIMAQVDDAGNVVFSELPNATQLDYIKRGFDRLVDAGRDAVTGKLSPEAVTASRASTLIRNAHAAANGAYEDALEVAADSITRENAAEFGFNMLAKRIRRETVVGELDGMPGGQRQAMMQGLRSYIDDVLANVGRVASDPNVETRQVRTLINQVTTPASQAKVTALIGRDNAAGLFSQIDEAAAALELRAAINQNSKTAVRMMANATAGDLTAPGVVERIRSLQPIAAASEIAQSLTGGSVDDAVLARKQALFSEIADVLTRSGDDEAKRALMVLQRLQIDQPASESQARLIGNAFAAAMSTPAYLEGQRALNSAR